MMTRFGAVHEDDAASYISEGDGAGSACSQPHSVSFPGPPRGPPPIECTSRSLGDVWESQWTSPTLPSAQRRLDFASFAPEVRPCCA
jgi:hypothetical protein